MPSQRSHPFLYEYTVYATPHPEIEVEKVPPEEEEKINWAVVLSIPALLFGFLYALSRRKS